jgi:hypothetical protein
VVEHPARALIEPLTYQEARPMTDRIDPPDRSSRRPWPEVTDLSRLYDHGRTWCVNARAHPDRNGGYPDPERHLPWHECHTAEAFVDDMRRDLDGAELGVAVYAAAPFRFGQPRGAAPPSEARVVVETWPANTDEPSQRVSIGPADALHLARILVRLVDELTFLNRAA